MTRQLESRRFSRRLAALAKVGRWLTLAPLAGFAGCSHYDIDDFITGHEQPGHGGVGHGGAGHGGAGGCLVDGVQYQPGESFPSADGCNDCFCSENGQVGCTLRFCIAICGGIQGLACDDGQYCEFAPDAQCGAGDQTGICVERPEVCTREFRPVCGCDGATYGNACTAAAAGVSVVHEGECGSGSPGALQLGDTCGGFRIPNSGECGDGLFCQHQPGALCGAADAPGECVLIPDVCADLFDPVCGCDGETYGNACEAAASQVGILERGACP